MRDNVKKVTSNKLGVSLRVPTDVYEDKLVLDVGILKLYSRFWKVLSSLKIMTNCNNIGSLPRLSIASKTQFWIVY